MPGRQMRRRGRDRRSSGPGCGAASRSARRGGRATAPPGARRPTRATPREPSTSKPQRVLAAGARPGRRRTTRGRRRGSGPGCARGPRVAHPGLDPLDVVGGRERLDLADRPLADRDRRREIGEDLLDLEAGDELHEVEPVRADVARPRAARRPCSGSSRQFQSVGEQQPVLQVAAVHVPDVAELAAARARTGLLDQRVEADVEVRAVDEPAALGELEQLAPTRRRSGRAASRRRRACPAASACLHLRVVEVVRRRQVDDVDAVVGEQRLVALVRPARCASRPRARASSRRRR